MKKQNLTNKMWETGNKMGLKIEVNEYKEGLDEILKKDNRALLGGV